jgi:hypothetical protein
MGPEAHCNSPPPSQRVRTHNDMLKLENAVGVVLVATFPLSSGVTSEVGGLTLQCTLLPSTLSVLRA